MIGWIHREPDKDWDTHPSKLLTDDEDVLVILRDGIYHRALSKRPGIDY
jgi:hypothetical protein